MARIEIARRELESDRSWLVPPKRREGRGAGREGVVARVVAGREGQQSRTVENLGEGKWWVTRGGTSGKQREVERGEGGEAGVVSRLRPPSGERLLANYL